MISNKKQNSSKESDEKINIWEIKGLELLHQKYKYDFTLSEKQLIKNMLKESPPPIQYRRKVNIYI
jgi:hypothetical protein